MAHGAGWQIPSGHALAQQFEPGDEGYWMHLRPRPTDECPLRASVATSCAFSVWNTPGEARDYLNHPGEIPAMARHYIEWAERKRGQ